MTGIEIVKADVGEESFAEVFGLLLELHRTGGYAPLSTDKAALAALNVISEDMTFIARVEGNAVGTIGMTELAFWYSEQTFLQDAWLFVKPEHRSGRVGVRLMQAARDEAQARGKLAFVTLNNPDRRQKATRMSLESQVAGFVPLGYTLKIR
jgi:GNAT superfamily N-acetyltransferase